LGEKESAWKPPVLKTVALTGEGVSELLDKVEEHRKFLQSQPRSERELLKAEAELVDAIKDKVESSIVYSLKKREKFQELLKKIVNREIDPASAAEELLRKMGVD
jgi:LAO/AO transport system kinase